MSCFIDNGFIEVYLSQVSITEITHKPVKDEMPNSRIWYFRCTSEENRGRLFTKIMFSYLSMYFIASRSHMWVPRSCLTNLLKMCTVSKLPSLTSICVQLEVNRQI